MKQSKLWVVLCAAILLLGVAGCLWVLRPTGGDTVEILQDGKLLYTLDLSRSEDQVIEIPYTGSSNIIQVQDGKIRCWRRSVPIKSVFTWDIYLTRDCPLSVCPIVW